MTIPRSSTRTLLALFTLLAAGCTESPPPASEAEATRSAAVTPAPSAASAGTLRVEGIASPAPSGSAFPRLLARAGGDVFLAWLERRTEPEADGAEAPPPVTSLRLARRTPSGWDEPVTIARATDLLFNWADVPELGASGDLLAAAWTRTVPGGAHASEVVAATSLDDGRTWSEPEIVHDDRSPTEHAFPAFAPTPDGGLVLAWLDGRRMASAADHGHDAHAAGPMTLRAAVVAPDGKLGDGVLVDDATCECCSTDAVAVGDATLFAWRDRTEAEVRDVAVARRTATGWSEPSILHEDAWTIHGCPVNGPALAAAGDDVAAAWFTAADDSARVHVAFSSDGGRTWSSARRVDEGAPLGRATLARRAGGGVLVGWLEGGEEEARFLVRPLDARGEREGGTVEIARVPSTRAAGFPRLVATTDGILAAWTVSDDSADEGSVPLRVEMARVVEEPASPTGL